MPVNGHIFSFSCSWGRIAEGSYQKHDTLGWICWIMLQIVRAKCTHASSAGDLLLKRTFLILPFIFCLINLVADNVIC